MSVRKVGFFDEKTFLELDVTGNTYGPEGQVKMNGKVIKDCLKYGAVAEIQEICTTCNDSKVSYDISSDEFQRIGEPTEAALYSLVEKLGSTDKAVQHKLLDLPDSDDLEKLDSQQKVEQCSIVNKEIESRYTRKNLFEFSRDRKSMSVLLEKSKSQSRTRSKELVLHCKGAPEHVLERCKFLRLGNGTDVELTKQLREKILSKVANWGEEKALRVLGFAILLNPIIPKKVTPEDFSTIESGMTFMGLVGMLDPPRPEVKDAIQKCKTAGIRVVVITGDNKKTAESICRQIGVFTLSEDLTLKSFTGQEFDAMTPKQKLAAALTAGLFSRTEPTHKSELVDLLKQQGFIVAMVIF
jgi:Ca2+ transporting ATPase